MKIFAAHATNRKVLIKVCSSLIVIFFTMQSFCQSNQWKAYFDSIEKVQDLKDKAIFDSSLNVLDAQERFIGMAKIPPRTFYPLYVSGEDIFMGNYYKIYSLQKETGDINWVRDYGHHLFNTFYTAGNYIIVRGGDNDVRCLDKKTGEQKWIASQFSGRNKFVVYKDMLLISEFDTIKALDINNGNCLWRFISDTLNKRLFLEQYENSVIWGDRKDNLYRLDIENKELLWKTNLPKFYSFYILGDKILVTWKDRSKKLLDTKTGKELERYIGNKHEDPIYAVSENGIIRCKNQNTIYMESLITDSVLWSFSLPNNLEIGYIVINYNLIYNNVFYFPSSNGMVYAIDLDTGKALWTFNILTGVSSVFAFNNGILYLINDNSQLIAIDLDLSDGVNKWKYNLDLKER